jgi:DNA-directed RNA polymerase specialized sigma24 family protein
MRADLPFDDCAKKVARKVSRTAPVGLDRDDMLQEARIALWRKADKLVGLDPEEAIRMAVVISQQACIDSMRRYVPGERVYNGKRRVQGTVEFDESHKGCDDQTPEAVYEQRQYVEKLIQRIVDSTRCHGLKARLDVLQATFEERTVRETSALLGVSDKTVMNHRHALAALVRDH